MKKSRKILTSLLALIFISAALNANHSPQRVEAEEPNYAPYVKGTDWGSPWGLFGTTEERDGLNIVYDGWYLHAINPEYISVNLTLKKMIPSIPSGGGYAQEAIFNFAFLTEQNTAPDWGLSKKGLYLMTRNIDGNLFLDVKLNAKSSTELQDVYVGILPINAFDLKSITLQTIDNKISLTVNDIVIGNELLATVAMSEITNADGQNFFALQSYAAGGAGEDADKRQLKLSYFATFEGQIPDPAITADPVPIDGDEDYSAPAGLGLTAKKYNENVVQKDEGVAISNTTLLYTALTSDCIEINGRLKGLSVGSNIKLQLNKKQAIEDATILVYFTVDQVLQFSVDGINYVACGNALPADINIKITLVEGVYRIICNGEELTTIITKDDVTGQYGTFLSYSFSAPGLLDVYSMSNPQLFLDVKSATTWNSPFDGIKDVEGETVVIAHSTIKTALDYKYVALEFKVNGLLDTNIGEAHLGFALLRKNEIFDSVNPTQEGIHLLLRKKDGNLEVKLSLRTEFLGTIAILDWTPLGIDISERITLRFINDAERDTYRIILNDKEIKAEKMYEIMTIDGCNRNGQSFLATACWHNTEAQNENIFAERSFIVYSLDNKLDEGDIPTELTEIGKPEGNGGGETSEDPSSETSDTTSNVVTSSDPATETPQDPKKKLWPALVIGGGSVVVVGAVIIVLLFLRKKKQVV